LRLKGVLAGTAIAVARLASRKATEISAIMFTDFEPSDSVSKIVLRRTQTPSLVRTIYTRSYSAWTLTAVCTAIAREDRPLSSYLISGRPIATRNQACLMNMPWDLASNQE
jgi:hypothetical protein